MIPNSKFFPRYHICLSSLSQTISLFISRSLIEETNQFSLVFQLSPYYTHTTFHDFLCIFSSRHRPRKEWISIAFNSGSNLLFTMHITQYRYNFSLTFSINVEFLHKKTSFIKCFNLYTNSCNLLNSMT